ncbi:energy transducer TonB [bacterium]|nr:energy transducer TonB [bacterium]
MMIDVIKKRLETERKFSQKTTLIALILAIVVHIGLFVGIREFKKGPNKYKAGKRKIFKPLRYTIPKKKLDKKMKKTKNIYKPRKRAIPKAVPDPRKDEEPIPEIPEIMIDEDTTPHNLRDIGAIIPPMLVKKHPGNYPQIAKEMGLEGAVKVVCTLDNKGQVRKVALFKTSGSDILDKAAMNAAKLCVFTAAMQGDTAVDDIDVELTYKYLLEGISVETY